jgi:hypothetical protein
VNAEELFRRYFLPLYPPDARADLARARATDANPARNPALAAHIEEATRAFVRNAPALFAGVAGGADLALDGTDASVHRLSAALSRGVRDAWAAMGAAGSAENVLFNAVVHGAAYVGSCIVANHGARGDAWWSLRRPLWESVVRLRSPAGEGDLTVFHWWLKSLADDEQNTTLADRYRAHVEVPCAGLGALPVFVGGPARALPRLKEPRYDSLHKYLRAHLPEVRDLGRDFPSPERFEAFSLRWLDFHVVGGGRMVILAGASPQGLHLFWMSAAGFDKTVFLPCDAMPGPIVRVDGERIVAMTSEAGAARIHEMLWWGP